jgi:hypothetical protein
VLLLVPHATDAREVLYPLLVARGEPTFLPNRGEEC